MKTVTFLLCQKWQIRIQYIFSETGQVRKVSRGKLIITTTQMILQDGAILLIEVVTKFDCHD
jgi:hypothetical protein